MAASGYNSETCESEDDLTVKNLLMEDSLESDDDDELYVETELDSSSNSDEETLASLAGTSMNQSFNESVGELFLETGPGPSGLKRRAGSALHRESRGRKKVVREVCETDNRAEGKEQLLGLPAELGWSAQNVRRRRNIDFEPNEKPGVSEIELDEKPC